MNILSTGCLEADRVMDGGIRSGVLSMMFSAPMVGKSHFAHQIAWRSSCPISDKGFGRPALIIDTENEYTEEVIKNMASFMKPRFPTGGDIDFIKALNMDRFFGLFGLKPVITHKEDKTEAMMTYLDKAVKKGKKKVGHVPSLEASDIWAMLEKRNYGLIVIDSISNAIKSRISTAKVQNLAARDAVMSPLLQALRVIANKFDVAIFYTNHYSKSPINVRDMGKAWGGDYLLYNTKYVYGMWYGLKPHREKFGDGARRLYRVRHSTKLSSTYDNPVYEVIVLKKDEGYISLGTEASGTRGLA